MKTVEVEMLTGQDFQISVSELDDVGSLFRLCEQQKYRQRHYAEPTPERSMVSWSVLLEVLLGPNR
jgi:hypothetical protein